MVKGFYECGSTLYKCMTFADFKIHLGNIKSLSEAHKSLLFIIDEHNDDVYLDNNITASEIQCKWYEFGCKKRKLKELGE